MVHDSPLIRSLVFGLTAFRAACLVWLAFVLVATWDDVARPVWGIVLVGAAAGVTGVWWWRLRTEGAPSLLGTRPILIDVGVATALSIGDGLVYDGPHTLSLGSAWPLASVLSAGVAFGKRGGALAGLTVGIGRTIGDLLEDGAGWSFDEVLARASTIFLFVIAGTLAGYAVRRLLDAEEEIALVQAREEVARTLHDGVLQTLAVVQRRSDDGELVDLAREQERELREYLFGAGVAEGGGDLGAALRHVAARVERRDHASVRVVVAPDLPSLADPVVDAVAGAVGEACTNAVKHGTARTITVYAEPTGRGTISLSVKDDGSGFAVGTDEGMGLTSSIRGRIDEVGGSVEIDPNPGHGTEVRLTVPTVRRTLHP